MDDASILKLPDDDYYDIMLLGKTCLGKSTLGNKLLQVEEFSSNITEFSVEFKKDSSQKFLTLNDFEQDGQPNAVTNKCKLLVNDVTKVRVLDTPGFSSMNTAQLTAYEGNLQIFRDIVHEQLNPKNRMRIKRLLYFFPERGVPEKVDAYLQDELKLMYHYFGTAVFDNMVIIVTQEKRYQSFDFTGDCYEGVKMIFCTAVKKITNNKFSDCPPIVYVSCDESDEHAIKSIQDATVLGKGDFAPEFQEKVCIQCGSYVLYIQALEKIIPISSFDPASQDQNACDVTKCHPSCLIPKYNTTAKIIGGVAHVATCGIPYLTMKYFHKKPWPGFTNTEMVCSECKSSPRTMGCCSVLTTTKIEEQDLLVNHEI